ncbi:hypothetical protein [Aquimarina sp. 2201CG5-10]|uniref:hypothetical protein n=1 Tax=Aquimarina callyspongiae TaxID=3098150 RepID=UPI002AB5D23F|nr:hypothetical protein [Aquimarina sp. 2201CG5-10]MDY8135243.1 hypothetical protein [Aquimarina sp. 2201CG5-10]
MRNILKISLALVLCISGCSTTKGTDNKDKEDGENSAQIINPDKMVEQGFSKGTLTVNKSNGCPYILTVEKYKDKLDPINLGDFFKGDMPEKVWVKYASLRMASRCNEARPVSINEISKRE